MNKRKLIQKTCPCGIRFEAKDTNRERNKTFCSNKCRFKYQMTPERRAKASAARKKWLDENPEKHPWRRRDKHESEPCEVFKAFLRNAGVDYVEEYQPLKHTGRFFSIDVAWPHLKLGIEINGEQHYNRDKTLKKYYADRHSLIEAEGWKLYEVHYTICYDAERMAAIVRELKSNRDLSSVPLDFKLVKKKKPVRKGPRVAHNRLTEEKVKKYRVCIENSNPTAYGWISRASKEMKVSHTQVKRFVRKYMPDLEYHSRSSSST